MCVCVSECKCVIKHITYTQTHILTYIDKTCVCLCVSNVSMYTFTHTLTYIDKTCVCLYYFIYTCV